MPTAKIEKLPKDIKDIKLGNAGIDLAVHGNDGEKMGRLRVTNTGVRWIKYNGKKGELVQWKKLITWLISNPK